MPTPSASTVTTAHGRLRGFSDGDLQIFRGIPFAAPPTGPRRFAPPAPAEAWIGDRDATQFGMSAPQNSVPFDLIDLDVGPTAEDCLYLNVVTPGSDDASRPVLVWIHGGAFTIGSGSQQIYDPRPLARRGDVVVVSINYRLGALGFLALGAEGTTANAGLLDQVSALRWVRDNIAAFGGDPRNVTIFGESAGGMSVGCLLGMPEAQGLFQRAIAMSGAAHAANSRDVSAQVSAALCEQLEVAEGDVEALRRIPVDSFLKSQATLELRYQHSAVRIGFRPNIDDASLRELPYESITTLSDDSLKATLEVAAEKLSKVGTYSVLQFGQGPLFMTSGFPLPDGGGERKTAVRTRGALIESIDLILELPQDWPAPTGDTKIVRESGDWGVIVQERIASGHTVRFRRTIDIPTDTLKPSDFDELRQAINTLRTIRHTHLLIAPKS